MDWSGAVQLTPPHMLVNREGSSSRYLIEPPKGWRNGSAREAKAPQLGFPDTSEGVAAAEGLRIHIYEILKKNWTPPERLAAQQTDLGHAVAQITRLLPWMAEFYSTHPLIPNARGSRGFFAEYPWPVIYFVKTFTKNRAPRYQTKTSFVHPKRQIVTPALVMGADVPRSHPPLIDRAPGSQTRLVYFCIQIDHPHFLDLEVALLHRDESKGCMIVSCKFHGSVHAEVYHFCGACGGPSKGVEIFGDRDSLIESHTRPHQVIPALAPWQPLA